MKIGIVNDLSLAQEALKRTLGTDAHFEVAWQAYDGEEAIFMAKKEPVDIILMDLIMPKMNGSDATREIMRASPCAILVVTASVEGNSNLVYEALGHGAIDAIRTPNFCSEEGLVGSEVLLDKLYKIARIINRPIESVKTFSHSNSESDSAPNSEEVIAIGASTGGPQVLEELLRDVDRRLRTPIVIVQHVDKQFARGLIDWLNTSSSIPVVAAREGEKICENKVYVAVTDYHLVIRGGHFHYEPKPLDAVHKPSINVFFESLAHSELRGSAIILTGMGNDGAEGLLSLKKNGWHTIAQKESTCVVPSMPAEAIKMNSAAQVLSPEEIARWINHRISDKL